MDRMEALMVVFRNSLVSSDVYRPEDSISIAAWLREIAFTSAAKKVDYLEIPAAFDIEASSFYSGEKKAATMYVWSLGLLGRVIVGRTWAELIYTLTVLSLNLELSKKRRLVVYVHNLDYDFQFLRKWLEWESVFSLEERKPLYALSTLGIEFRCSYKLSGYSLETVGKNLKHFPVRKMAGDLDYSVPRHSSTPLSETELGYVVNDSKVVMAYIAECMMEEDSITRIPMTKTGYVRRYVRNRCFKTPGYKEFLSKLTLSPAEYDQLKDAFQGGFTHASPFFVEQTVRDVTSYDFTSSYPAVLVAEKFPMSPAEEIPVRTMAQFEKNLRQYCCLFTVELWDVEATFLHDNYISSSRCSTLEGEVLSNGRVVRAAHLITTITEVDYMIIRATYRWRGNPAISQFRRYEKRYLPRPFVLAVLELYRLKTELKGVPGREEEYQRIKEMLNSCYGMCVTSPLREDVPYVNNLWDSERRDRQDDVTEMSPEEMAKKLSDYNRNRGRFLFFPWGVWCTAYARRNLWSAILTIGPDYLYADTDSIKVRHISDHMDYILSYNKTITQAIRQACEYHHIPPEMAAPKTIRGKTKPLGVWDFDGHYDLFKTLGAKRYIVLYSDESENGEDRNKLKITVAGVNKHRGAEFLLSGWAMTLTGREISSPFQKFNNNLIVPPEATGKLTHTYIDHPLTLRLVDYQGQAAQVEERSVVHMEPTGYSLTMASAFLDYVHGLKTLYV